MLEACGEFLGFDLRTVMVSLPVSPTVFCPDSRAGQPCGDACRREEEQACLSECAGQL